MPVLPAFLSMALLSGAAEESRPAVPEYQLKAQVMIQLLSFAEWPPGAGAAGKPFELVVMGKSPFGAYLDDYARDRTIQRRAIRIRYLAKAGDPGPCSAVFLCRSEAGRAGPVCAWARSNHVLTLSDDEALARQGVMVNLVMEGRFVRLAVNLGAVSAAGLSLSSRLLKNAHILAPAQPIP